VPYPVKVIAPKDAFSEKTDPIASLPQTLLRSLSIVIPYAPPIVIMGTWITAAAIQKPTLNKAIIAQV
jgi:hypothetical protein